MRKFLLLFPFLLIMLACNFNTTIITPVPATRPADGPSATVAPAVELPASATPEPEWGSVAGSLSYPSDFVPPMRVVLFNLETGAAYYVDTAKDQRTYSLSVPPGTYYVVSYSYQGVPGESGVITAGVDLSVPGTFAGGYSQMVPCGLAYGCNDHSLVPVVVEPGASVTGIDPGDWYAPEGSFPKLPTP